MLQNLDPSTSAGMDGIHPRLLRSCSSSLAFPLSVIMSKSLETATFPTDWSKSLVIPLFKGGSRCEPLNYRPVSLTSVCCKVMERLLVKHILDYLETGGLLEQHQFGFDRRGLQRISCCCSTMM